VRFGTLIALKFQVRANIFDRSRRAMEFFVCVSVALSWLSSWMAAGLRGASAAIQAIRLARPLANNLGFLGI
jgi:hypothetical protein